MLSTNMNKEISDEEVRRIANLAKIDINEDEINKYSLELSKIVDYIDLLIKVDTKDILPLYTVLPRVNVYSEDIIEDSFDREDMIKNARKKDRVNIIVKGVFK